jgi:hypothetical protein
MGLAFFTHEGDGNDETIVQQMTIAHDGKVGIGNTAPPEVLTVEGNISSSGAINTLSHITASGDISASGTIYGTIGTATQGTIDHDSLSGYDANEHLDWTNNVGTIHAGNYTNQQTSWTAEDGDGSHALTISHGKKIKFCEGANMDIDWTDITPGSDADPYDLTFTATNTMGSGFTVSATTDSNATTITEGEDLLFTAGTGITCETTNASNGEVTITNAGVTSIVATANETTVSGATGAVTIGIADDVTIPGTLTADTRKFAVTSNTDGDYEGDVVYFGSAEGMTAGGIWHYVLSEEDGGIWTQADADAEATCDGLLAVSLGEDPSEGMLLRGMVTLNHQPGIVADTLFVSTTATQATSTAPSGNLNIVRIIGYCLDNTYGQIWFNPDNSYIEVTGG